VTRPRALWIAARACGALLLAGCHSSGDTKAPKDAGTREAGPSDASLPPRIDISVTGCAAFEATGGGAADGGATDCLGPAPLTVRFSPVGSPGLTTFLWRFGDGSPPVSDRAPTHTYALPGRYDVSVTGGAGTTGTVSKTRPGLIVAQVIGAGGPCDIDAQCASGLSCVCSGGAGCGPAFTRGICSTTCLTGFCGTGAVCAAYPLPPPVPVAADAAPADGGSSLNPLCLRDCGGGAPPCPDGFTCGNFHAGGNGAGGWVRACLPNGAAADLGASCRNGGGSFDNSACASGYCAPVAANGLCAASCQVPLTCPAGTACARVAGVQICLAACSPTVRCASDPQTACRAASPADSGVDAGLPVLSGDVNQTYCAPR
jgi:PKD repeat protein